ncbi:hypothetical protein PMAYCL1PPCAC_25722, partial [Pristionchus mayeri]
LIVISGEKQARIEFLEELIDTKPEVLPTTKTTDELEKKIEELEKGREEDRVRINDMASKLAEYSSGPNAVEMQLREDLADCKKKRDELIESMIDMTNQLKEER